MIIDDKNIRKVMKLSINSSTGLFCENCGSELIVKKGYRKFLGCSNSECNKKFSFNGPAKLVPGKIILES
ncbi:hypothetical protein OD350_29360 (plasmid) [Clostridium beijerinckii]|uniref:hypothetical protein n=1 Tax=Clostridium beijerinckii TaxID=1520 RepID=UPI00222613AD|nr:hypothetical protein [Clostridium beijerinckii]UYZ38998.1 hypothetical protein OD350_29360 [Clostridium beijerinckii]